MSGQNGFTALVIEERDGAIESAIRELDDSALPDGDVTVAVAFSGLNYKDGMVLGGLGKLVRSYPHVPGIDFAGTVIESASPRFKPGDAVVLTGWRVGEAHWGGYATKARVKADWLVPLPDGLNLKQAMAVGTAGFSAMLAVMALETHGLKPGDGDVLVTGAVGGVGSIAVTLLASLGYSVAASTGRSGTHGEYLRSLGAAHIIDRAELEQAPKGPLGKERWAGVIDSVAGPALGNVLANMKYGASLAAVGLAGGPKVEMTVIPFLLRGVNILGIDSVMCPPDKREEAWRRLARDLPKDRLDALTDTVSLAQVPGLAGRILRGHIQGRTVVDLAL